MKSNKPNIGEEYKNRSNKHHIGEENKSNKLKVGEHFISKFSTNDNMEDVHTTRKELTLLASKIIPGFSSNNKVTQTCQKC